MTAPLEPTSLGPDARPTARRTAPMVWRGAAAIIATVTLWAATPGDTALAQPSGVFPTTVPTDPQPEPGFQRPPTTPVDPATPIAPATMPQPNLDELPAPIRVGHRAERLSTLQRSIPVVVLVPDAGSYVAAMSRWTPTTRFPVLIDDGTRLTREHVARFVRAFGPERVVRWTAPDAPPMGTPEQRRAALEDVVRRVWAFGSPECPTLADAVRGVCGTESPGVVVASASDPAWTAGLALAIGRGQPILWVDARRGVSDAFTREEGEAFARSIEQGIGALGLPWNLLGDTIDTVAICMNTPVKTTTAQEGQWLATTDRVGHASDDPRDGGRWGWASQIHGNEAEAAYRAMCALFLPLDSGWFFDGYPRGQPFETYALRFARDALLERIPSITLIEHPSNGLAAWRAAGVRPIEAALLMVNTHGMRNFFELPDGTAWCGDVPILARPGVLSFIHSWSAYQPDDRNCVSGRWFERGVYAYCGSVQEPYLVAFQKPIGLAGRLLLKVPWGVACRIEGTPAWKIAMFGDPLITLGGALARTPDPLPLEGAVALDDQMRDLLRAGDLGGTIAALALLGRDADAARLIGRLSAEEAGRITPALAELSLPILFRQGRHDDLQAMYRRLDEAAASDPMNRDLIWLSCRSDLPNDGSIMALLRPHVRPEQQTSDIADLALMAFSCGQRDAAITLLTEYRRTITDQAQLKHIDAAMRMVRGL